MNDSCPCSTSSRPSRLEVWLARCVGKWGVSIVRHSVLHTALGRRCNAGASAHLCSSPFLLFSNP